MVNKATLNQVTLVGYLGNDPDVATTRGGRTVINFRMATQTYIRDEDGNGGSRAEWHRIAIFGPQADAYKALLKKGMQVFVQGRLQTRDYVDDNGVKRYATDVIAEDCFITGKKNGNGDTPATVAPAVEQPKVEPKTESKATTQATDNHAQPKAPARRRVQPQAPAPKEEPAPELEPVTTDDDLPF